MSDGNAHILKNSDYKYAVALGEIGCLKILWVFLSFGDMQNLIGEN